MLLSKCDTCPRSKEGKPLKSLDTKTFRELHYRELVDKRSSPSYILFCNSRMLPDKLVVKVMDLAWVGWEADPGQLSPEFMRH